MAPVISFICIKFFLLFHFHSFLPPPPLVFVEGRGKTATPRMVWLLKNQKIMGKKIQLWILISSSHLLRGKITQMCLSTALRNIS